MGGGAGERFLDASTGKGEADAVGNVDDAGGFFEGGEEGGRDVAVLAVAGRWVERGLFLLRLCICWNCKAQCWKEKIDAEQ